MPKNALLGELRTTDLSERFIVAGGEQIPHFVRDDKPWMIDGTGH